MKVLITGSNGFIGKNVLVRLKEENIQFDTFNRGDNDLDEKLKRCNFIIHLAGVNRPKNESDYFEGNTSLIKYIVTFLKENNLNTPVMCSSSIHVNKDNQYGYSKRYAEKILHDYSNETGALIYIYRLPNVFGKWSKPNYNSAVATFCYNIINDLPININDPKAIVNLVYIDDVVHEFINVVKIHLSNKDVRTFDNFEVKPVYKLSLGDIVELIRAFKESKDTNIIERVGSDFTRALYSTYLSFFKPEQFNYSLVKHEDSRGLFVEMLKTKDSGQFSFFTARPGITRGNHYHHSKNEKFLVVKGEACFGFRHILTDEYIEIFSSGENLQIIESIPGWSHSITNIGVDDIYVMLWANEIFNPENPDTISYKVNL